MTHMHTSEIENIKTAAPQNDRKKSVALESLSFSSYVRLCSLISVCLGIVVGGIVFLLDIVGWDTTLQWGLISFNDTELGVVVLFVGPFIFGVTGFVGSLFSYRLFIWALRKFSGLPLTGTWKEVGGSELRNWIHPPT